MNEQLNKFPDLLFFIRKRNIDFIKLYLQQESSDLNAEYMGKSMLQYAINTDEDEIIQLLLDSNVTYNKYEIIKYAFLEERINSIKIFLERDFKNNSNQLLSESIYSGDYDFSRTLFKYGIKLKQSLTIDWNNKNIVKAYLEAGANPNTNHNGVYPLSKAISNGDKELVKLLKEYGAEFKAIENNLEINWSDLNIVESALEAGLDVNKPFDGLYPLTHSIIVGSKEVESSLRNNYHAKNELSCANDSSILTKLTKLKDVGNLEQFLTNCKSPQSIEMTKITEEKTASNFLYNLNSIIFKASAITLIGSIAVTAAWYYKNIPKERLDNLEYKNQIKRYTDKMKNVDFAKPTAKTFLLYKQALEELLPNSYPGKASYLKTIIKHIDFITDSSKVLLSPDFIKSNAKFFLDCVNDYKEKLSVNNKLEYLQLSEFLFDREYNWSAIFKALSIFGSSSGDKITIFLEQEPPLLKILISASDIGSFASSKTIYIIKSGVLGMVGSTIAGLFIEKPEEINNFEGSNDLAGLNSTNITDFHGDYV